MQKRQVWIWGVVLLVLVFFEARVGLRPAMVSNKEANQLLQDYWHDPTPQNEYRWTEAEKALDAKRAAARRLRSVLLVIDGLCILLVGAKLAESLGVKLPVKL